MKANPFKKTKAQLAKEKRSKENLKRSMAELKAVVARISKWRRQIDREIVHEN